MANVDYANRLRSSFANSVSNSKTPLIKSPYIYSKTEEIVWKWEQLKLCRQSINTVLHSTMIPQGDCQRRFILVEDDVITVLPPAKVTGLHAADYHIGIASMAEGNDSKIIVLGLSGNKKASGTRAIMLHFSRVLLRTSSPDLYSWCTEYWVSDSVVIDARSYCCTGTYTTTTKIYTPVLSEYEAEVSGWADSPTCDARTGLDLYTRSEISERAQVPLKTGSRYYSVTLLVLSNLIRGTALGAMTASTASLRDVWDKYITKHWENLTTDKISSWINDRKGNPTAQLYSPEQWGE